MTDQQGSGPAHTAPQGNTAANKAWQAAPKNHGHPAARKDMGKRTPSGAEGKRAASNSRPHGDSSKRAPVFVCTKSNHPRCEAGTFDAAALLASVLEVVEPTLREGLQALEERLLHTPEDVGAEGEIVSQALRAATRQITDSLRAAVIDGMRVRERHLAQLVVIDRAAAQSDTLIRLQDRIGIEIERAGLRRVVELSDLSLFNLAGVTEMFTGEAGDACELVTPAYVDADTGRVIERGWLRPVPPEDSSRPQGKSHGSVSRENKSRNKRSSGEPQANSSTVRKRSAGSKDESGADVRGRQREAQASEQLDQRRDGQLKSPRPEKSVPSRSPYPGQPESRQVGSPATEKDRSGPSGSAGSDATAGRESNRVPQSGSERSDVEGKRRNPSARNASRVTSSYFVKRMLGNPADQEQPPRRTS